VPLNVFIFSNHIHHSFNKKIKYIRLPLLIRSDFYSVYISALIRLIFLLDSPSAFWNLMCSLFSQQFLSIYFPFGSQNICSNLAGLLTRYCKSPILFTVYMNSVAKSLYTWLSMFHLRWWYCNFLPSYSKE
jgi:hypothetical protein